MSESSENPSDKSPIDKIVARASALYRDADLGRVANWKRDGDNRKAIGHLPIYVPRELIHAAGMLPVGVCGNGDLEIIKGDAYFQSYICHLPRSVIELGLSGRLDALDGMLFPSICDVIRNLSGMWKLLFPDAYVKYLDVPQNFDPSVGGRFYRHELGSLRGDLEKLGGIVIDDDALAASIRVYNRNSALVRELYATRRDQPERVPAWEVYLLVRAGYTLEVEEHNTMLRAYLDAVPSRQARVLDNIRVVIRGAFCEQPPVELIRTLERAGCYIVDDDYLLGSRWLEQPVKEDGDPLDALVEAFLNHSADSASLYTESGDNGGRLVQSARRARADGVILSAPSFCDPALLDQPMQVAALEAAGIPFTTFLYAENTGQFQVIREQAGTFADSIRLWSDA